MARGDVYRNNNRGNARFICSCRREHNIDRNTIACDCGRLIHAKQNYKGIWYVTSTERPRYKD